MLLLSVLAMAALVASGVFAISSQVLSTQFENRRGISLSTIDDSVKTLGRYESGSLASFGLVRGSYRLSLNIEGVDFKGSPATVTITATIGGVSYTVSATQPPFANPGQVFQNSETFDRVDLDDPLTFEITIVFDPAFLDDGVAIGEIRLEVYKPSSTNLAIGAGLLLSGSGIGVAALWRFFRGRSNISGKRVALTLDPNQPNTTGRVHLE